MDISPSLEARPRTAQGSDGRAGEAAADVSQHLDQELGLQMLADEAAEAPPPMRMGSGAARIWAGAVQ